MLHFIQEHHLVSHQQKLVVAVSGGPDSVCLLHIMVRLLGELDIRLHVAHLNHQLRGTESEADAQYVSNLAQQLGIPASIEQRDVKSYQNQQRISCLHSLFRGNCLYSRNFSQSFSDCFSHEAGVPIF